MFCCTMYIYIVYYLLYSGQYSGSTHQPLTLDELITELAMVDQIQERENKLSDFFKMISEIISDFEIQTEGQLASLHKQRDTQVAIVVTCIYTKYYYAAVDVYPKCTE